MRCLSKGLLITGACNWLLTGCLLGPDFHAPVAPHATRYTASPQPVKTIAIPSVKAAGSAQHFISGQDVPAKWWMLFHSEPINQLITEGLQNSPTLSAATAILRQTQENYNALVGSAMFPQITAQLAGQRVNSNGSVQNGVMSSRIFTLYNATVNVAYTLDFFGAARRGMEALQAQVDNERFQLDAAYLALTGNIVTTAITVASYDAQIKATKAIIQSQQNQLSIIRQQFHLGGVSGADVYTQESQVATTQASLPPLEQNLAEAQHALAVLVGVLPSEFQMPIIDLNKLHLPTQLPLSLPSMLTQQRPDVRASEALLHAANAQVGVATANLYPQITLSADYGWQALAPSNLFKSGTSIWDIGGALTQPIFKGGSLRAERRAAIEAWKAADAQYRQTVLQAFQNVADTLRALQHDAQTLKAELQAEKSARASLTITEQQFRLGSINYLSLLTAQRQYQQSLISRIQAQAARYNDTAALFLALGGGWWNRQNNEVFHER